MAIETRRQGRPNRFLGAALTALCLLAASSALAAARKQQPAKLQAAKLQAVKPQPAKLQPAKLAPEQAAKLMGRNVYFGTGASLPVNFVPYLRQEALARDGSTNFYVMSTFLAAKNYKADYGDKWKGNLFFISSSNRDAATAGVSNLHRGSLFQLSKRIEAGRYPLDTVVVRVSPPDKHGMVSLGTTGDLTLAAIRRVLKDGGKVIAEVNENVPRTRGNRIRYSELSAVIESQDALSELNPIVPNPTEQQIARNVAALVPNRRRVSLQVGIGNALGGVGEALKNKRLRIWSELGGDWVIPLLSGEKPKVKDATFSFLLGTAQTYKLAGERRVRVLGNEVVNNPKLIAKQKRMTAINTGLEMDLAGNLNAEEIDGRKISMPGGQPDFMKGAFRAPKGQTIAAIRSINKNGDTTIVTKLHTKLVTTPGKYVNHLVTEWGATRDLSKMKPQQRAYELIRVASPLHRTELAAEAKKQGLITEQQEAKLVRSIWHSLHLAIPELAAATAPTALAKGLITQAQHDELMKNAPANPAH